MACAICPTCNEEYGTGGEDVHRCTFLDHRVTDELGFRKEDELPPGLVYGWICPKCGGVYSPLVRNCDLRHENLEP